MKITILTVGKIKEKFYREAAAEYIKRLGRYCKLEVLEFPDEKTEENASETEISLVKEKEAAKILKYLDENKGYLITLEINGTMPDSCGLAGKIEQVTLAGENHLIFVIGGSLGLSDQVIKRADYHLSFSKMTFPHQLMRVILLEQIYRAFRIIHHEPYHK